MFPSSYFSPPALLPDLMVQLFVFVFCEMPHSLDAASHARTLACASFVFVKWVRKRSRASFFFLVNIAGLKNVGVFFFGFHFRPLAMVCFLFSLSVDLEKAQKVAPEGEKSDLDGKLSEKKAFSENVVVKNLDPSSTFHLKLSKKKERIVSPRATLLCALSL